MSDAVNTQRRGFLGRVLGASAAATLTMFGARQSEAQQPADPDAWIKGVKGTHRTLFDFPQHRGGVPLLHIVNYLSTYQAAYKAPAGSAGAVGTFYSVGVQSSIPLAFNDAMWAKYKIGEYLGLKDASGKPYQRNVFHRPTSKDSHLLLTAMQLPTVPAFAEAMPALGIESLQKMGTTFLLCANAFNGWCAELEVRGKGRRPIWTRTCARTCFRAWSSCRRW